LKSAIIATFEPLWSRPWRWIASYGIPSYSTHRPLLYYFQILLTLEKLFVDVWIGETSRPALLGWLGGVDVINKHKKAQLSLTNPHDAKAYQKLLQFDVLTTLSLTILVYLDSFSGWSVRNLQNTAKFSENSNLKSSRSSKVIDLGANRKRTCNFLVATNSNSGRISYRFRDIDAISSKTACFCNTSLVWRPLAAERHKIST